MFVNHFGLKYWGNDFFAGLKGGGRGLLKGLLVRLQSVAKKSQLSLCSWQYCWPAKVKKFWQQSCHEKTTSPHSLSGFAALVVAPLPLKFCTNNPVSHAG